MGKPTHSEKSHPNSPRNAVLQVGFASRSNVLCTLMVLASLYYKTLHSGLNIDGPQLAQLLALTTLTPVQQCDSTPIFSIGATEWFYL